MQSVRQNVLESMSYIYEIFMRTKLDPEVRAHLLRAYNHLQQARDHKVVHDSKKEPTREQRIKELAAPPFRYRSSKWMK